MELKDFLKKHKIINIAELARLMYPDKKTAKYYLNNKLKGYITAPGRSPQQITQDDITKAVEVLKDMAKDIEAIN